MKKLICVLICVVLVFSFLTVFAENTEKITADLGKYGIIQGDPDGNLRLEDELTRAEAAKIIAVTLGMGDCVQSETNFMDVPKEHWASGYIHVVYEKAIIDGIDEKNFAPEEKLTNEQMVKLLVCMLGYKPYTMDNGGENMLAYMRTADRYRLIDNLDFVGTENAVRGFVAEMIYNALDKPLMKKKGEEEMYVLMDGNVMPLETLRINLEKKLAE